MSDPIFITSNGSRITMREATARRWAADFIVDIRGDDENSYRYDTRLKQLEAAAERAYDFYYHCPHAEHGRAALDARKVLLALVEKYKCAKI